MVNSTPDTPDVSETKLAALKMDELRRHARKVGIDGADELHKPGLPAKIKTHHNADGSPSASELSSMKLGELREHARKLGIDGADELHKPELLAKVKDHHKADGSPSASELSNMKLGELREHARKLGIDGADELHKPELLAKLKDHHTTDSGGRRAASAARERSGNSTPDTPDVSETKLAALKMDELRRHARKLGIDGADELHKPELLAKVKDHHYAQAHGGKHRNGSGGGTGSSPSASELSSMKLGELREHARKLGIDGADELHKPELLAKVKDHHTTDSGGRRASSATRNRSGNSTPDTPDVSETKLAALKMDELRRHARKLGIDGADELHKPELLAKVKDHHYAQAHGGKHRNGSGGGSGSSPSASELSSMKLGELREHARKLGIDGADELHKPELLANVEAHENAGGSPSASELSSMKLGELREHARKLGID